MLERLLQKAGVLRSFEDVVIDTSPEHFAVRGGHVNRHGIGKMNTNIVSIANQILQKEVKSFKPHHPENLHCLRVTLLVNNRRLSELQILSIDGAFDILWKLFH